MDRPQGRSTRYQALDAWRGIVCMVVVLEHAGVALWSAVDHSPGFSPWLQRAIVWCLTLNLGAPLFFVISGFCIASSLDSSRRKGIPPTRFLARRLWRIFPPYWASAVLIGLLVLLLDRFGLSWLHKNSVGQEIASPLELDRWQWLGNITLTETWRPRWIESSIPSLLINRVAWALCYQEQFYLICFLALILAPKRLYGALCLASVAIVSYRIVAEDVGWMPRTQGLFIDLWHEFAVGLLLYWRINVAATTMSKRLCELVLVIMCLAALRVSLVSTVAASAFGLLLILFYRWDEGIAKIKQLDPLRLCGRRSYAIYLVHLPVCTIGNSLLAELGVTEFWPRALFMIPAVTAGSVAAGWLFYALIDRRFNTLPNFGWSSAEKPAEAPVPVAIPPNLAKADAESPSGMIASWSA